MNDTDFDGALERAWDALERGDLAQARKLAHKLDREDAAAAEPQLLLAACAREEDDPETALVALGAATSRDPAWATPRLWMAEILSDDPERLEEALAHARAAAERGQDSVERADALILAAGLELDLGRRKEALRTVEELPEDELPAPLALEVAQLQLSLDRPAEAAKRAEALVADEPELADAWHVLGLARDALGDRAGCAQAWLETLRLDRLEGEGPRLEGQAIENEAEEALAELPPRARELLANVPIIVADAPAKQDVEAGVDPRLLGMFVGDSYRDGLTGQGTSPHLTQILLFRRNIERVADDEESLREELRTTIVHEAGHFFGMTEAELTALGLD
jgi:predicted Zn-dependent protease with MMP-like domain